MTVAVVDSGCDASHPDLANRVKHNVILVSGEYANQHPTRGQHDRRRQRDRPVPEHRPGQRPRHARGGHHRRRRHRPDRIHFGVAPEADLVCFAIGQVLFTTAVVTAYDVMMSQPDMWGIKVVNNSWGNSFRQFDPNDPVSVVTKAVADLGVTVVFASGNSGPTEMSLNPFSEAPWVISVGAGSLDHKLASFSSTGLDLRQQHAGPDRRRRPHRCTPATGSASTTPTCVARATASARPATRPAPSSGRARQARTPRRRARAWPRRTSPAPPRCCCQANPKLTPTQVRQALQATADADARLEQRALPFWQQGYGYVDLGKAVALVRKSSWKTRASPQRRQRADKRVLAADGYKVTRSDFWTYGAPRVAVAGGPTRTPTRSSVPKHDAVPQGRAVASVAGSTVGVNVMEYDVTVKDAAGKVIGTSTDDLRRSRPDRDRAFIDLSKVSRRRQATARSRSRSRPSTAASDPGHARQRLGARPNDHAPGGAAHRAAKRAPRDNAYPTRRERPGPPPEGSRPSLLARQPKCRRPLALGRRAYR